MSGGYSNVGGSIIQQPNVKKSQNFESMQPFTRDHTISPTLSNNQGKGAKQSSIGGGGGGSQLKTTAQMKKRNAILNGKTYNNDLIDATGDTGGENAG
jgi:hypothetical protein